MISSIAFITLELPKCDNNNNINQISLLVFNVYIIKVYLRTL